MVLSSQNCSRSIRLCRLYQGDSGHQRPFSGSGWHNPEVGIVKIAHRLFLRRHMPRPLGKLQERCGRSVPGLSTFAAP